jgi:uncharacterized protein (UPF0548 family)
MVNPGWTAVLLLLSPFVLVPLGLRLAASVETGPQTPALQTLSGAALPLAATAAASFIPNPGTTAAALSLPWLSFTLVVALVGAGRLLSRESLLEPGISADAGLIFIAVGGSWLTISRGGWNPLGFDDAIVQLTAVHFHYAGFALPIVAGFTASRLCRNALVPAAVIVGVPLTAIGITVGGWLEWIAATAMALAGMATAVALLRVGEQHRGTTRWLITAASAALLMGMGLAIGWAWSVRFSWDFLGLDQMAATHGSLNALGFGLLGLVGLNMVVTTEPTVNRRGTNLHLGRPRPEALHRLAVDAENDATTNPVGLIDRPLPPGFQRKVWERRIDHGDVALAAKAVRRWRGHAAAGIAIAPEQPAIVEGQTLALTIPVGPLAVSATCRIVDVVDEDDRFGFTYATLPHHAVDGEESFIVTATPDGEVSVTVTAVWRPATLANHLCPPLTRFLQHRAINRYLDGIAAPDTQTTESAVAA